MFASKSRLLRRVGALATSLACAAGLGCGSDRGPCEPEVCNPRDSECVRQVAEVVACSRDADVFVPSIRFATSDEVLAESEPRTPEQLEAARNYWAGEALVGLMPAGYDPAGERADSFRFAAALYDTDEEEIIILTDRTSDDAGANYSILVHEMVHAYQDAEYGLGSLWEAHATSFDRSMGFRAAIEGEADLHQSFVYADVLGIQRDDVDWRATYASRQERRLDDAQSTATPSLDATSFFPYAFGGGMMAEAFEDAGQVGVSRIALVPPDSVRHLMVGYDSAPAEGYNRDAELASHAVPILPGHRYLGGSAQGAWLINAMTQRLAGSLQPWWDEVNRVSADELAIFLNTQTGERVAVWRLVGQGVRGLFGKPGSQWSMGPQAVGTHGVFAVEDDTVLIAGESTDAIELWARIAGWQSVQEAIERDGVVRAPYRRRTMLP